MITLRFEIVSPETVNIAGEEFIVAGAETSPAYYVTKSVNESGEVDIEKTETIKKRLDDLCVKFGLPLITDPENPALGFKGKCVWALVQSDVVEKRKSPTAEQLAAGQRQGDVICNPITGKPLVNYYPKIAEIFGLAPTYLVTDKPF